MTKKYIPTPVSELMENQYTQERKEKNKRWARRALYALAGVAMTALIGNTIYQIHRDCKQEKEKKNTRMVQYYDANNIRYTLIDGEVKPILGHLEIESDKLNLLKYDEGTSENY